MSTTQVTTTGPTAKQIGKYIVGSNGLWLFPAPPNGAIWATNRYWAVPATRIEAYLHAHGIDPDEPGTYDTDRTVKPAALQPVNPEKISQWLSADEYRTPLTRHQISGLDAYVHLGDGPGVVFTRPDGGAVILREDLLDWLTLAVEYAADDAWMNTTRLLASNRIGGPAAFVAEQGDPTDFDYRREVVAVLMPTHLP